MGTTDSEWRFPNAATPTGSGVYYAVRFSPAADRDRHAMQIAWYDIIHRIAENPTDPGVARLKLDWWRNEVRSSLDDQTPHHPLMSALLHTGLETTAATPMLAIIDAAESQICRPALADTADFAHACIASGGRLFEVFCTSETTTIYNTGRAAELGGYWEAIRRLCRPPVGAAGLPTTVSSPGHNVASLDAVYEQLWRYPDQGTRLRDEPAPEIAKRLVGVAQALARKLQKRRSLGDMGPIDRPPIAHLWTARRCC